MIKKLNISQKLTGTYFVIIIAAIISGIFCLHTLFRYQEIDNEMISENIPCLEYLKQIQQQTIEIRTLSKNWIYLSNQNDKNSLIELTKNEFPNTINQLKKLAENCNNIQEKKLLNNALINNIIIINSINKSAILLNNIDAFFNEEIVDSVINIYTKNIEPKIIKNEKIYTKLIQLKTNRQNKILKEKESLINLLTIIVFFAVLSIFSISILSVYYTKKKISSPLSSLKYIIEDVSLGEVKNIDKNDDSDEIAEMQNALKNMTDGLREKIKFANSIGKAKYDINLNILSEKDQLGLSLIEMSENLQKSDLKIRMANDSMNNAQSIAKIGNWSFDFLTNSIFWSNQMFTIFEIEPTKNLEELIKSYKNKIHQEDRPFIKKIYTETIENNLDNFDYEHRLICKNNVIKYIKGKGECKRNSDGKIIFISGIIQDITEQKLFEEELNIAKETAENLAKVKDEFMSSMSHEVRTPLNGIIGFTEILLKSNNLEPNQLKQLEAIKTSGDILLVIINDILDIAKIESGKMSIEQNPLKLKELTELIVDTFAVKINEKQLNFSINIDSKTPSIVAGDSVRLSQIFFNFISNAIKFTPKNGNINLNIKPISINDKLANIEFSINDTGIGIPEEKLNSVFEPFVQTSNDTARKYGGTGLGLTIVKKLVELMKGNIRVESTLGVGTTFTIVLPMIILDEPSESYSNQKTNNDIPSIKLENKKLKILLAEDNLINQFLAKTILAKLNHDVVTVENGAMALEEVQKNKYDLILMDLMMPEMDGYEATQKIRNLSDIKLSKIPIIAFTADVTNSVISKCTEVGMNGYLSKPIDSNLLNTTINKIIDSIN